MRQLDDFGMGILDFGIRFRVWFAGSHFHTKFFACKRQFVTGKQRAPDDSLTVNFRSVGAAEISDEQQSVGSDNQAVHFGNTAFFEADIAQIVLTSDERDVARDLNGASPAFDRNQMCAHGSPLSFSRTTAGSRLQGRRCTAPSTTERRSWRPTLVECSNVLFKKLNVVILHAALIETFAIEATHLFHDATAKVPG